MGHFMAYQRTIIKAHRSFIGESRTTYDSCYRMKAANIKSLEWDWAKALPCCVHRSSELHSSTTCPDVPTSADMRMEGSPRKTRHINGALRLSMWPLQQPAMESVHLHPLQQVSSPVYNLFRSPPTKPMPPFKCKDGVHKI